MHVDELLYIIEEVITDKSNIFFINWVQTFKNPSLGIVITLFSNNVEKIIRNKPYEKKTNVISFQVNKVHMQDANTTAYQWKFI